MHGMERDVVPMPTGPERGRRLTLAIAARRRLEGTPRAGKGRAWINGREGGGPNPRYAHLHRTYD